MKESKISYHRLFDVQERVAFTSEDGIDALGGSVAISTCLNCGFTELPVEEKETIDLPIKERRKIPQSSTQIYTITQDLL